LVAIERRALPRRRRWSCRPPARCGLGARRHALHLLRKPLEPIADGADFAARAHDLAVEGIFALGVTAVRLRDAALELDLSLHLAAVGFCDAALEFDLLLLDLLLRLAIGAGAAALSMAAPGAARPFVLDLIILLIVVGKQCDLVVLIVGLDDVVEPLADRHAGAPRRRARRLACFRTKTSQIPGTARFHSHDQNHIGRNSVWPAERALV